MRDISELVASVGLGVVLEPIIVRQTDSGHEIVIGSRRFAAAKRAGLKTIHVVVKPLKHDEALVASMRYYLLISTVPLCIEAEPETVTM